MDISIGELARRTGVKVPTVRYYERIGLMPAPPRTEGKQRRYGAGEIARLNFIRHARELGFEVEAIRALLALPATPEQPCAQAHQIARRRMIDVERRIARLTALHDELSRMLAAGDHGRVGACRVIETLADTAHRHGRLSDTA